MGPHEDLLTMLERRKLQWYGHGRVVGKDLRGVACCMGSGIVVLKYSAKQRLMCEIKQKKKIKRILFKNYDNYELSAEF